MKKIVLCSTLCLLLLNPFSAVLAAKDTDKTKVNPHDISIDTRILNAVKIMKDTPANASYKRILGNNPTKGQLKLNSKTLPLLINHMENMMVWAGKKRVHSIFMYPTNIKTHQRKLLQVYFQG